MANHDPEPENQTGGPEPLAEPRPVVYVVDDEPSILELFRQIGGRIQYEVKTYAGGVPFLEQVDLEAPGCLVLDLNLPDISGLDVLEELGKRQSQMPVIFMSGRAKVSQAVSALKAGSLDFVEKPFEVRAMIEAIQRAIEFDRARREKAGVRADIQGRLDQLTPRESEVLELVVKGYANKTIAAELGVSPKTVEVHRANVMRKSNAHSLAELVRMVMTARGEDEN